MDMNQFFDSFMLYFIGGLLAAVPLLIWGYLFYRKSPERKDVIALSFSAGVLSVIPIFVVLGMFEKTPINFGSISIGGLSVYNSVQSLASQGGLEQLGVYILVSIIAFFFMYLIVGIIIFLLDLISGEQSVSSYEKILERSFEAPLLFITLGIFLGLIAYLFDWSFDMLLYNSIMVGAVEEFAKHLVLRFSDENKFRTINDAIEFSIMVALGFAFLENIIYFVDRVWLACDIDAIRDGICTIDSATGRAVRDATASVVRAPGSILVPFLGRSLLSTLTHIVASGIFGYFYGLAYFAPDRIKAYAERPQQMHTKVMAFAHKLFHIKAATVLREEKMLEGAMIAMTFHGVFNFLVDEKFGTYVANNLGVSSLGFAAPLLIAGLVYLSILFKRPENDVVWKNRHVLEKQQKLDDVEKRLEEKLRKKTP